MTQSNPTFLKLEPRVAVLAPENAKLVHQAKRGVLPDFDGIKLRRRSNRTDDENRLLFLSMCKPIGDCLVWSGRKNKQGYGHSVRRRNGRYNAVRSHRLAYQLFIGAIPEGLDVLHTCDNPPCVNPEHLFVGTQKDNSDDMIRKGRQRHVFGEQIATAKLSRSQVLEIKSTLANDKRRGVKAALARHYNVSPNAIHAIASGKTWESAAQDSTIAARQLILVKRIGEMMAGAKLTDAIVLRLRHQYKTQSLSSLIRANRQFSKAAIWQAVSGYSWSHLPGAIPKERKCQRADYR